IRKDLNKQHSVDPYIEQDLLTLELESVDRAHSCDISLDCTILRTKDIIPSPIELHHNTGITRVASLDKLDKPFTLVTYEHAQYAGNGRFNKGIVFAFILNRRIYLTFNPSNTWANGISNINIRGVFEDPTEVWNFLNTKWASKPGYVPFTNDSDYPMKGWMSDSVVEKVTMDMIRRLGVPVDKTNNANSDLVQDVKAK
ncbi:MAG TPA: hypothetical protein VI387_02620, partial [Candidatus Brocadiales bacterium]|nr:hypothetical protein [Candidatus Brocadiales bacterium]